MNENPSISHEGDLTHRLARLEHEIRLMQGAGVIDLPKLLAITRGQQ